MKLNIGAGERLLEGFINHDFRDLPGIDLVCDAFDLPQKITEPIDEIACFHMIEHFNRKKCVEVLKIFHSLLKDGGVLRLEIPNMEYHARLILGGQSELAEYYCFGGQDYEGDQHYSGWTPFIAEKRLTEAGFKEIDILDESSMTIRCVK